MAPGQAPHQAIPWRDAHPISLLYPLLGFFSRAWSLVRGPGPAKPWMVAAVTEADQGEAKARLAGHHVPWVRHAQGEARDSGAPETNRETANLKTSSSLLEAWGLSDGDVYYEEEGTSVPKEQGLEFTDSKPAPLSLSLPIRALQGSDKKPGEEKSEEEGAAEDEGVTKFSYPLSHRVRCVAVHGEGDGEGVNNGAPRTSRLSPGPKPSTWVYCPREEEDQATEEERRESKEAEKTSVSPSPAGSNPKAWEFCSGKKSGDKDEVALEEATEQGDTEPEPHSSVPAQRLLLRSWENQPSKCIEEDDEEDEDGALGAAEKDRGGEAEASPSIPSTSPFLKAWVYRPGEDTEEEDEEEEDSDSGSAEEEGEAEPSPYIPSTSPFLKAWVYRPGEDTEEEEDEEEENSDLGSAEEEGEAEASPSIPCTSPFLKAWVYRPGEDTEEEEEEEEDKGDDEAADSEPHPSLRSHSTLLRAWIYRPGEETEEEEAVEEWGEAEPCRFQVAIYVPGEKPPPPWSPPKLPLRLRRQLKFSETHTRDPDPETPLKARKVRFSEKVTVHFLYVWAGPAQAARRGPWEQLARDRSRFARRIAQAQEELGPCLTPDARARAWAPMLWPHPLPPLLAQATAPSLDLSGRCS
uniref:Protein phosphatase 1 regulatory subunit 15A n=1 Tax=Prolemur simus TaxID=1328070 RepID=A0A8C8YD91_PROSS